MKKLLPLFAFLTVFVIASHAHAAVYYFNNAVDQSPTELGNYWNDGDATDPALSLPDNTVDDITILSSATYDGNALFNGAATNEGTVTGNAVFNNTSANNGTVVGNATYTATAYSSNPVTGTIDGSVIFSQNVTFTIPDGSSWTGDTGNWTFQGTHNWIFNGASTNDDSINGDTVFNGTSSNTGSITGDVIFNDTSSNHHIITGNATFNDSSYNYSNKGVGGTVSGNATFNGDLSENNNTVAGTKTRRYTSDITTTRNFVTGGPWTVVADGAVVDVSGATYNNTTTFSTINGGLFTYFTVTKYWYNAGVNANWTTLTGNWWDDVAHTMQSASLPDGTDSIKTLGSTGPTVDLDTWIAPTAIDATGTGIIFTSATGNAPGIDIRGNATFNDSSINNNTISGNVTFNGDAPENNSTVTGTKTRYYDSNTTTIRDLTGWTVVADGAVVDVSGATYTGATTFTTLNGGSFTGVVRTYYFNNAVNQDPTEQGNYWYDDSFTVPAGELPDFNGNEVTVGSGVIFDGNITFNGSATNEGEVTGNAIFNDSSVNHGTVDGDATFNTTYYDTTAPSGGTFIISGNHIWTGNVAGVVYGTDNQAIDTYIFNDTAANQGTINGNATFNGNSTENTGTITGTKTRRYTSDITTIRNFVTSGPWTIIADGCVVDVTGATTNENTVYVTNNGGSFQYGQDAVLSYSSFVNNTITLKYSIDINPTSIPATSDYTVSVNGSTVPVNSVSISGKRIILTLSTSTTDNDEVLIDYVSGTNPIKDKWLRIVPNQNLTNQNIVFGIPVGGGAVNFLAAVNSKIYASTIGSGVVSVIDTVTNTVLTTLSGSTYFALLGTKLYVTSGASVSVIDTNTDTTITQIGTGSGSYFSVVANNKLYVANQIGNTVSVIDTTTDTVGTTISVDSMPDYLIPVGTKLYLTSGSNTIDIIDTTTDTVSGSIALPTPSGIGILVGNKLYINGTDRMYVIDITTDTVISTISMTGGLGWITRVGTKLYVNSQLDSTVLIIDTTTDTLIDTISVGHGPYFNAIFGSKLYVINQQDTTVSVIDTVTDTVTDTITVGQVPYYSTFLGNKLYIGNNVSGDVSIINTTTIPSLLPNLTSFSTSSASGSYTTSQPIPIQAHFGRTLSPGSTMTILLNSGASVTLNSVSGSTLSGTYTIGSGDTSPDLSVRSITSASVSDTASHTRTSYDVPSSVGSFSAENSFITRNLGDTKNITIGSYQSFATGSHPYQVSVPVNGYLYVANQGAGTVSVINATTGALTQTINVEDEPYGLAVNGTELYVANVGSDTVSVIDTATNTVTYTTNVGVKPYYVATIGTNVYVTNGQSNTVSVINTSSHTVTNTIPVGSYPRGIKAHGTDLYVANYGDPNYSGGNYISVINSLTNTVSDTIILPAGSDGPRGVTTLGSKVYVANFRSNNVSVIDTATNEITDTIDVGMGPRGIIGNGTTLYVENFDDGTISVIDTNTNTVTNTVDVGHSPAGMSISGSTLYLTSFQDNQIYLLDTTTNTLRADIPSSEVEEVVPSPASSGSSGGYARPATPQPIIPSTQTTDCLPAYKFSPTTGLACLSTTTIPTIPSTNIPLTPTIPSTVPTQLLKWKSTGPAVRYLQHFLNSHGFSIAPSGVGSLNHETQYFGLATKAAVMKFQKIHKLIADGIVGKATWGEMR